MLLKTDSFAKSLAVLSLLESSETLARLKRFIWIEAYQNGREQGILVWDVRNNNKSYYVAQYRRSDEIVVYVGEYAMQSISEDAYNHPNFFKSIEDAVNWLEEKLLEAKDSD